MPFFSDLQSALMVVVLFVGFAILMREVVDPAKNRHRFFMFLICGILAARYLVWRITETVAPLEASANALVSWTFLGIEVLATLGSFSSFVMMSRTRERSYEVERHWRWWELPEHGQASIPRVAILIATFNESQDILERTIVGAQSLRYPEKTVYVLDDGKRDWLRDYCASRGVEYLRRPDNSGAKAGNINNALQHLARQENPPDFVAVLDADFVPHQGFLRRTLALFHDRSVGLVQTPQHFFNADPIQHNLGLARSYPDEQRFFFDHVQSSRDAWGIAFCCGTSSVIRFAALIEIGGFPANSVTEDFLLTLVLQTHGWKTVYLNEALTEGLAPEGLAEYVTQRARWCLGLMQIARSDYGPLGRAKLRLRDRWSVADSMLFWLGTFTFRLAAIFFPLLYWFFNLIVVDAGVADVLRYFGPYYVWSLMVIAVISRGTIIPVINDVTQLIGAVPIMLSAFGGLLKPHGRGFKVTPKGGDRSRIVVQWRLMWPYLAGLILTLLGLTIGIFSDRFAFYDAGDGKIVVLFWTIYNLFVLLLTVLACVELPRKEQHVTDTPERASFRVGDDVYPVWVAGLTSDTARIRGHDFETATSGKLNLRGVGEIPAVVLSSDTEGVRLDLKPDDRQYDALIMRFYAKGVTPGIVRSRADLLIHDLARRLSFNARKY